MSIKDVQTIPSVSDVQICQQPFLASKAMIVNFHEQWICNLN